jgi:hypothetical protein
MSCQVTMEACLDSKELNPEDMKSEVEPVNKVKKTLWSTVDKKTGQSCNFLISSSTTEVQLRYPNYVDWAHVKRLKITPTPKIKNYHLLYDISPRTFTSLQNDSSVKLIIN